MTRTLIHSFAIAVIALTLGAWTGPRSVLAAIGPRCYVKPGALVTPDGNSWGSAYPKLQTALNDANCTEIWVAAGVYTPNASEGQFLIVEGKKTYGGFEGNEALRSERQPAVHITILSGDVGGDDVNTDDNHIAEDVDDIVGDNSPNIVTMVGTTTPITMATVLDGFVITAGDGSSGAGLICSGDGLGHGCSPTLSNLIFSGNHAVYEGGALYNDGSNDGSANPILSDVWFIGNSAANGGAVYNQGPGGESSPKFIIAVFKDNWADSDGGAVFNNGGEGGTSNSIFDIVTFNHNSSGGHGGAVYSNGFAGDSSPAFNVVAFVNNHADSGGGGAVENWGRDGHSDPTFTNVTFQGNSAGAGGAVFNDAYQGGASSPVFTNVTFSSNTAINSGGAMYNQESLTGSVTPTLTNVVMWGDSAPVCGPEVCNYNVVPTFSYSIVQGSKPGGVWDTALGYDGGFNLDSDPMLEPLLNNWILPLGAGSSAIDAGNDGVCAALPVGGYDQRLVTRPQGPHCDIGAYELAGKHVSVSVAAGVLGTYIIPQPDGQQYSYAAINNGPATVTDLDHAPVVSSIRVLFGGSSYSEMMGFSNNSTTDFWFPWYNNTAMDSQFRVSNLGEDSTTITVSLAGSPIDTFSLGAGTAIRKNYPGQNNGPMHVSSSGGTPILATVRVLYAGTSFSEMMGFPNDSTTDFYFPWYNNTAMDSQFRVSNLGDTSTTITVSLAGTAIDSFTLNAGAAIRKSYAGQNNGPMHVSSSTTPILATIRVLYAGASFSEMMGYPDNTTTDFWFPWYDNVGANTQFRVSNLGDSSTTITVSLAGATIDSFTLDPDTAVRKTYAALNDGAFHITSSGGVPILPTERILYGASSFYELMGFPETGLTGTQWFPWYNNTAMDSQMRIAVP